MATLDDLSKIPEPSIPKAKLDEVVPDLGLDLDEFKIREKLAAVGRLEHELTVEIVMLAQRKRYIFALFGMISVWLMFIGWIIFLSGDDYAPAIRIRFPFFHLHVPSGHFKLSDGVLIALITTTTVNVLALFLIAARWLFPALKEENPKKK